MRKKELESESWTSRVSLKSITVRICNDIGKHSKSAFKSLIVQKYPEIFRRQKRLLRTYFNLFSSPISFVVMWWRRLILRVIANWFCAVHLEELKQVLRVLFTIFALKNFHSDHWFNFFLSVIAFWTTTTTKISEYISPGDNCYGIFLVLWTFWTNNINHIILKNQICWVQETFLARNKCKKEVSDSYSLKYL